jgi:hypothetical protein
MERSDVCYPGAHLIGELRVYVVGQTIDAAGAVVGDQGAVFEGILVRVGGNYFAEEIVGIALQLLVVNVRHRFYKPTLSFLSVVVGLATRHVSREAGGVSCPVKVERGGRHIFFGYVDLEWTGCVLACGEGKGLIASRSGTRARRMGRGFGSWRARAFVLLECGMCGTVVRECRNSGVQGEWRGDHDPTTLGTGPSGAMIVVAPDHMSSHFSP